VWNDKIFVKLSKRYIRQEKTDGGDTPSGHPSQGSQGSQSMGKDHQTENLLPSQNSELPSQASQIKTESPSRTVVSIVSLPYGEPMPGRCPQCGQVSALEQAATYADGATEKVCHACGEAIKQQIRSEGEGK
jgi:hypothetical protein